jgi:hypothetical protein
MRGTHMNSGDNTFRRLAVAVAVMAAFLLFGASGAQSASAHVVVASGSLAAEEHTDEPSDEESEDPDEDSNEDEDSDDEDGDNEDSEEESDEPTDEPSDEPTFSDPATDGTDDVTEMPTNDASATPETASSPLGWILLGLGVASAIAAFLVYRRNRLL